MIIEVSVQIYGVKILKRQQDYDLQKCSGRWRNLAMRPNLYCSKADSVNTARNSCGLWDIGIKITRRFLLILLYHHHYIISLETHHSLGLIPVIVRYWKNKFKMSHCHIMWHEICGQHFVFHSVDRWPCMQLAWRQSGLKANSKHDWPNHPTNIGISYHLQYQYWHHCSASLHFTVVMQSWPFVQNPAKLAEWERIPAIMAQMVRLITKSGCIYKLKCCFEYVFAFSFNFLLIINCIIYIYEFVIFKVVSYN